MARSLWAGLLVVFIISAVLRIGWVAVRHGNQPDTLSYPDEQAYLLSAQSLAAGHGLVDEFGYRATYMPAYPAFLAFFELLGLPLMATRIAQAVLAALIAPATFLLAAEWTRALGKTVPASGTIQPLTAPRFAATLPLLAGLAAACDPFLIFFAGLLLTEALFSVCLVAAWWMVFRLIGPDRQPSLCWAAGAGLALLGCIMLRPSATLMLPLAAGVVLLYRRAAFQAWPAAAVICGVVVAGLLPWGARNASLLGEWRWTTTRGGISLYDGLQPGSAGQSDLAHTKSDPQAAGLDELSWDEYWRGQAGRIVRDDPVRVARLAVHKFLRTWNIVPNEPEHRRGLAAAVSAGWMLLVLATATAGLWLVRSAARWWVALLIPVIAFTLLHMIFVGSVRYRVPLMPMLFVLSAAGLCAWLRPWLGNWSAGAAPAADHASAAKQTGSEGPTS